MKPTKWTRRQVLGSLAVMPFAAKAAIPSVSNAAISSVTGIFNSDSKLIRCELLNFKGEPFEVNKMDRFHICDLLSRPFQIDPEFAPGEIVFTPVTKPFRISLPVEVPGFGVVFLYADNRGAGYTARSLEKTDVLFLNYEFAADRLATIHTMMEDCRKMNIELSPDLLKRIASAEKFFALAKEVKSDDKTIVKWTMESLRESLYAGEMLVIEKAKHTIKSRGTRPGFMFGCNAFKFRDYGSPYTKLFESLFNYATLPFYMSGTMKIKGQPDYSRVDSLLNAIQNTQIICKGHPLIFLTPDSLKADWISNKSFGELKQICMDYIKTTVNKFKGRIHIWDVINEAHVQPDTQYGQAVIPDYTKKQTLDLSVAAAKTAREVDPTCYRIINNTGTWGDYYMGRKPAVWQQNVYDYLEMLEENKCEYEAIGLQYYHSGRDLLEFERDVERFSRFNKPIHITELQIPSSSAEINGADWWGGGSGGSHYPWHGTEFTETIQADWVESVYTMLYSKSYIDAITWWDMSDPGFVPHGGLVNEDMSPKESYSRLKALLDQWKSMV
jgi:endo-1,4-beta-xylanase